MKSIFIIMAMSISLGHLSFAQSENTKEDPNDTAEKTLVDSKAADKASTKEVVKEATGQTTDEAPIEFGEITGTQKYKITCTSGTDIREITVITQEDSSTGVVYKKFDTLKTMALAKTDPAYADQVAEKIKGNLETAGFTCVKE
jgi:hypothetical protein